jgi:hypothetical protein
LVASITNTLTGVTINQYGPATGGSVLGSLLATTAGTFNTVASLVGAVVKSTLSPLLDPILNTVLQNLGIEIAKVRVGANLSCHPGQATLVI